MLFYRQPNGLSVRLFAAFVFVFALSQVGFSQLKFERPFEPSDIGLEKYWRAGAIAQDTRAEGQPSDGIVDPAFVANFEIANGTGYVVEELPDGKLLIAGLFKTINGVARQSIVRLNADRSVDASFSAQIRGTIFRMIPLTDGKILIGGPLVATNATNERSGVARLNADGSLDTTFDIGMGPDGLVRDMVLQPDGKLLVAGEFRSFDDSGLSNFGLVRLNTDGSRDQNFVSPLQPVSVFSAAAVFCVGLQPDGKIIIGGSLSLNFGGPAVWLLRLHPTGAPDNTFISPSMNSNPWELSVQPDGKIVIVGFFTSVSSTSRPRVARLNVDGTLDATFTPGTGASGSVLFARVLSNGKVLVSGTFSSFNGTPRGGIAMLNNDGSLDTTFAPSGSTTGTVNSATPSFTGSYFAAGSFARLSGVDRNTVAALGGDGGVDPNFMIEARALGSVRAVLPQASGKMIVGGFFNRLNNGPVNCIVRVNSNGSIDSTFAAGVTITGSVTKIVTQPDGKLLVVGSSIRVNNGAPQTMVRLNTDGTHDTTFLLPAINQIAGGLNAAVQPDGKIVYSYMTVAADPSLSQGLVRLNSDGSLDSGFSASTFRGESLAVLPSGKILVAGPISISYVSSGNPPEPHKAIVRLNSDGSHDRTFQSGLNTDTGSFSTAYAMHVQADGKIVLAGRLYFTDSTALGTIRLNPNGSVDGSFLAQPINSQFGTPQVFALEPTPDGKFIIGGYFQNLGGTGGTNVARLNANGSVDTSLTASTEFTVSTVAREANGSTMIGGSFLAVNGTPRAALARLLTSAAPQNRAPFDFDGDGKTDIGIFRSSVAEWWINRSSNGTTFAASFGASTDTIVPADYTGDGKADIAVWRPSSGEWFVLRSEDFSFYSAPFGADGDKPVPADYDADGKADLAVFRASSGTWFIQRSAGGTTIEQFGVNGDQPVAADYDGDGKADIAIFRPSNGQWWLNRSTSGLIAMQFGNSTVKAVQGDYTGDGKADVAFWQPSNGEWFVLRSEDFSFYSAPFGASTDVAAPGDYDGDGKFDFTVFRPSTATWFSQRTTAGVLIQQFGSTGDTPVANAFVR